MAVWGTGTVRPVANYWGASAIVGTTIWHFGGASNSTQVYTYDTATDTWTAKTSLGIAMAQGCAAVTSPLDNNYIYLFPASGSTIRKYNRTTQALDAAYSVPSLQSDQTVASDGTYIYFLLGTQTTVYRYDCTTNGYTAWGTLLNTYNYRRMVYYDGNLYIIGGYSNQTAVERLNTTTAVRTTMTVLPAGRYMGSVGARSGLVYYIAGANGSTSQTTNYAFDPVTNTWSTKTAIPTLRHAAYGGMVGVRLYVQAGWTTTASTVNSYWDAPELDMGAGSSLTSTFSSGFALMSGTATTITSSSASSGEPVLSYSGVGVKISSLLPVVST